MAACWKTKLFCSIPLMMFTSVNRTGAGASSSRAASRSSTNHPSNRAKSRRPSSAKSRSAEARMCFRIPSENRPGVCVRDWDVGRYFFR